MGRFLRTVGLARSENSADRRAGGGVVWGHSTVMVLAVRPA